MDARPAHGAAMIFRAIEGSQTAHCCFEATVVDTTQPNTAYPERFREICECFSLEEAQFIADALNARVKNDNAP
jgi:hypothetical protein